MPIALSWLRIILPHWEGVKTCDVHDRNFPVGKVVTTVFAKTQAVIRRTGDKNWELVVRRSFADYTWLWLQDACKEYGLVVKD